MKTYKYVAEKKSRISDKHPKACHQVSMSVILQKYTTTSFGDASSIQRKPVPMDENNTGTGALYKDDSTSVQFTKVKNNLYLLDENILISWNDQQYIKKLDGTVYNFSDRIVPSEKVLAIGMSEYGRLQNNNEVYTHLQTTEACPCFVLILRSKTETALYHITIHNEFTENDLYEFIGCPKDEEGDYDFIKINEGFITEKGIQAHLYQGEYEPDMQAKALEYKSKNRMEQIDYLCKLNSSPNEKQARQGEYIEQSRKYDVVRKILIDNFIIPTEEKKDNAKIKLTDGTVSHLDSATVSSDLGRLVVERGKKFGNSSRTWGCRESNVHPTDDYSDL